MYNGIIIPVIVLFRKNTYFTLFIVIFYFYYIFHDIVSDSGNYAIVYLSDQRSYHSIFKHFYKRNRIYNNNNNNKIKEHRVISYKKNDDYIA